MTAKRVDANQKEIVKLLRRLGFSVFVTSAVGHGFPDLVSGYRGKNYLFELKDGNKPVYAQHLTPFEEAFFKGWNGQCQIITSADDVLDFVNNLLA